MLCSGCAQLASGALPHGYRTLRLRSQPFGATSARAHSCATLPPCKTHPSACRRNRKPLRQASLRIYEAHVGMASEEAEVASYDDFRRDVLPRIARQGFNCVQLMAVQEHPYYASFGYHVTNPFAPASRSGDPEALKALIDEAHGMGIAVLIDVVHSHICKNVHDGLAGFDFGQDEGSNYFHAGDRGYHSVRPAWSPRRRARPNARRTHGVEPRSGVTVYSGLHRRHASLRALTDTSCVCSSGTAA